MTNATAITLGSITMPTIVVTCLITLAGAIVLGVVGWIVTARIGRLTRDSTETIAQLARDIALQQVETARAQVQVNRQTQAMSLLKDRTALKEELLAAIDAREQEITFKSKPDEFTSPEALYVIWRIENKAKVLFGDDVMRIINSILAELKRREDHLMKIRVPNADYDKSLYDMASASAFTIMELKADLDVAIDRYSSMGHIRMLDELPSKSGTPSK